MLQQVISRSVIGAGVLYSVDASPSSSSTMVCVTVVVAYTVLVTSAARAWARAVRRSAITIRTNFPDPGLDGP